MGNLRDRSSLYTSGMGNGVSVDWLQVKGVRELCACTNNHNIEFLTTRSLTAFSCSTLSGSTLNLLERPPLVMTKWCLKPSANYFLWSPIGF